MKTASIRAALIAAAIVALTAFALLRIGGAVAQSGCTHPISADGDYSGSWTRDCLSQNNPTEPTNPPSGTRYARFYTFTLSAGADITIELTSSTDTYMYLMQGTGANGAVLHENDDVISGNTNSRIAESLSAGDYTIEATTYELTTTGDFTLTVSGLPDAATPTATPTLAPGETRTATPTFTPTPTVTPAPTQPSVPADVLNRLTALESLAATQQELFSSLDAKIIAMDSRIAALEADASRPTPLPTVTPTPTTIPTAAPIATATLEPTATHPPIRAITDTPTAVPATIMPVFVAGPNHACSLISDGTVSCQGTDNHSQVSGEPHRPPIALGFTALAIGSNHTCALHESGTVYCWGSDEYGQSSPPSHGGFIAVQAGDNYTCAMRTDGYMECWGRFEPVPTHTPVPVLVAGPNHMCLLNSEGAVSCQGTDNHSQVPGHLPALGFTALAIGSNHTCALHESGTVHCWGSDEYGQSSPPLYEGFIAVQAGDNYTCAIHTDGDVVCWGRFEPVPTPEFPTP